MGSVAQRTLQTLAASHKARVGIVFAQSLTSAQGAPHAEIAHRHPGVDGAQTLNTVVCACQTLGRRRLDRQQALVTHG